MTTIEKTQEDLIDFIHTLVEQGEVDQAVELYEKYKKTLEMSTVFVEY